VRDPATHLDGATRRYTFAVSRPRSSSVSSDPRAGSMRWNQSGSTAVIGMP